MATIVDMGGETLRVQDLVVGVTKPSDLNSGTALSSTELGFLDGITAGTVLASKAVVVDASKNIQTFGAVTGGSFIASGTVTAASYTPVAGTNTVAPIVLTSGTNLTTASAGSIEFDGKIFYMNANASSRQVSDCEQLSTSQAATTLANNNSLQNVFNSGGAVLSLPAATTYFFESMYYVVTGATTHTTALAFTASSAFTSCNYWAELWSTTSGSISTTAPSVLDVNVSTAVVLNATSTAVNTMIRAKGIIRTNAASTVTPQIQFSADPTGTCQVKTGSYFRVWPVGINTVQAVGNWT